MNKSNKTGLLWIAAFGIGLLAFKQFKDRKSANNTIPGTTGGVER